MKRLSGYEVISITKADGTTQFYAEGAVLYTPETDAEIAQSIVKVCYLDEETYFLRPMAFAVRKLPTPLLPEEEEIPEEDR